MTPEQFGIKDVPLSRIIDTLGLEITEGENWVNDRVKIALYDDEHYIDLASGHTGTGSIELVREVTGCSFSEALAHIRCYSTRYPDAYACWFIRHASEITTQILES